MGPDTIVPLIMFALFVLGFISGKIYGNKNDGKCLDCPDEHETHKGI